MTCRKNGCYNYHERTLDLGLVLALLLGLVGPNFLSFYEAGMSLSSASVKSRQILEHCKPPAEPPPVAGTTAPVV